MSKPFASSSTLAGQSFRDRDGQRWWVSGPRPNSPGQFIVEAEMKGSYPRVAIYVMTEREFHEHAASAELRPEQQRRPARKPSQSPR
ncbi:MAG TPA: hypothetical protein VEA35_00870 [Ramlibacter sp.]|nr:hypothetical protein [Ramlibacter sp.]